MLGEIEEFLTGARSVPEADRVLATVMFTDIVGSTARAAELGDARWRELLASHQAAMQREVTRFRGRQVKIARRRLPRHLRRPGARDPLQGIHELLRKLYAFTDRSCAATYQIAGLLTVVPYGPLHKLHFTPFSVEPASSSKFLDPAICPLAASWLHHPFPSRTAAEGAVVALSSLATLAVGNCIMYLRRSSSLPNVQGRCYLEEEATIARLAEPTIIIHIATHGQNRPDAPNFSSAAGRWKAQCHRCVQS